MFPPKKILVCTDFSQNSDRALQQAIRIAHWSDASLHLLYVADERTLHQCAFDFCLPDHLMKEIRERIATSGEENLRKQLDRFPEVAQVSITTGMKQGRPDEQILDEAHEAGADLIVMGAASGTGIQENRIGSVADRVARGARSSVLLVK